MRNVALLIAVLLGATSLLSVDSFQASRWRPHPLRPVAGDPTARVAGVPVDSTVGIPVETLVVGTGRRTALSLSSSEAGSSDDDAASPTTTTTTTTGNVSIVYCTGCRWMMRAAYFAQELLTTFNDDLTSVTLVPSRSKPGGTFLVTLDGRTVWDRKSEGGFPETKELKQRIRDLIAPDRDLGHSDVSDDGQAAAPTTGGGDADADGGGCDECPPDNDDGDESSRPSATSGGSSLDYAAGGDVDVGSRIPPHVSIVYCTGCKWMFRAAWYAQEILSTFQEEVNSVSLVPSRDVKGTFTVTLNDEEIWDRKAEGRHAEAKELKQRIRDVIVPDRNLGHSDANADEGSEPEPEELEELDDDDAAEQRRLFGVM